MLFDVILSYSLFPTVGDFLFTLYASYIVQDTGAGVRTRAGEIAIRASIALSSRCSTGTSIVSIWHEKVSYLSV